MSKTEKGIKLGADLRRQRELAKMKARDAVDALKGCGFEITTKALYSYETGERMPNADVLMALCKIYKTDDILSAFGYNITGNSRNTITILIIYTHQIISGMCTFMCTAPAQKSRPSPDGERRLQM